MFALASGYRNRGTAAYSELQRAEFASEAGGYTATRHQREIGTVYFDLLAETISGGTASTTALRESTEAAARAGPRSGLPPHCRPTPTSFCRWRGSPLFTAFCAGATATPRASPSTRSSRGRNWSAGSRSGVKSGRPGRPGARDRRVRTATPEPGGLRQPGSRRPNTAAEKTAASKPMMIRLCLSRAAKMTGSSSTSPRWVFIQRRATQ